MAANSVSLGEGGLNTQLDIEEVIDDIGLDEDEIQWRKNYLDFTPADEERLVEMQDLIHEHADRIANEFYDQLTEYGETQQVIGRSQKSVEQLKQTQTDYLKTLVGGEYEVSYFENRARIGKIHDLLDMPMKLYLGQFGVYFQLLMPLLFGRLEQQVLDRLRDELDDSAFDSGHSGRKIEEEFEEIIETNLADVLSLLRIITLDMQVVVDSYIQSYSNELSEKTRQQRELMDRIESDLEEPITALSESAQEIAEGTAEVSEVVTTQTGSMERTAEDVVNLSNVIENIASTAQRVSQKSLESEKLATTGEESATDALAAMEDLDLAVNAVSSDIQGLDRRLDEVSEITEVIDDIAEQTNLLALNASIEAARAGKAGEGFAVVADEIKALANQSRSNASNIEQTISEVQDESEETVEGLQKAQDRFEEGARHVEETMECLNEIVEAAQATASGIQEVSGGAEEQAITTSELSRDIDDLVEDLKAVTHQFEEIAAANEQQTIEIEDLVSTANQLTLGAE